MKTREIDYKYLESLPIALEIESNSLAVDRTRTFIKKRLLQPSFVNYIKAYNNNGQPSITLRMALGMAVNVTRYVDDLIQVSEATPCCLTDFTGYSTHTQCNNCKKYYEFTRMKTIIANPKIGLIPAEERLPDEVYDTGEEKVIAELTSGLQDRGVDALNAIVISGELWHFVYHASLELFQE